MSKMQIFCFTFAGGTTSIFDEIEKDLSGFQLVKLEYAGHGARYKEPLYSSFRDLAEDMIESITEKWNGEDYVLFGYSMGSLSVLEVVNRMSTNKKPAHVFLAAHEPLSRIDIEGMDQQQLEDWVKNRTINFGAVPDKLVNNKAFWRTYLPIYTADYSIIGKYRFEDLELRTDIPATVFYSESDTPYEHMKLWKKYFVGNCDFQRYDGPHFFIREHHEEMAEVIRSAMVQEKTN